MSRESAHITMEICVTNAWELKVDDLDCYKANVCKIHYAIISSSFFDSIVLYYIHN